MEKSSSSGSSSHRSRNRSKGKVAGIPTHCWCGAGIVEKISKSEDNPYRRYYRCLFAYSQKMDDNMDDVENTVVEGEAEEEEIRFPIRLYTKGLEPPAQKSINYHCCDTRLFPTLEGVLKADEWMELWNSPVGVCLKFYKLDFRWASRLVHCILTWQLQCEKKYEIWSLVNETPIRFSLLEFHHLTCLNCDYIENIEQPECEITEEMKGFWRKLGVSIEKGPSVEELIAACHVCETWSLEDRIRLGFLAIYVNFFEGVGS